MKALTLHQPWATLIAVGAKQIETRSWSTSYRGRLAIHAAKSIPPDVRYGILNNKRRGHAHFRGGGDGQIMNALYAAGYAPWGDDGQVTEHDRTYGEPLPLGAVVATCRLLGVLPTQDVAHRCAIDEWDGPGSDGVMWPDLERLRREMAFGNFTPGRYAWLLGSVERIDPVPVRGRQGLWEWEAA